MAAMSASSGPPSASVASDHIEPRRLLAFVFMVFGMFMAILDIQIVSASLSEIQAGLSASSSEISWVQTAYLIAEVIAIPLSGFLSRALGTRILFAISAAGFTIASLLCGLTSSIGEMIVWRAIQGFIGGGMIPTVFASAYLIFPSTKQHIVGPIIGLVATLAPTIGPTAGGYLTDMLSWHWLFFINITPGIIITAAVLILVDFDRPQLDLFSHFDWWGLGLMAGFLGALEYVLEEGPRNDWFEDRSILFFAIVSALSAVGFFYRVLTAHEPIVDLRAFRNSNFALGSLFTFILGIGLYGLTYLYPRYLAEVRGYSALMIGDTMFVSGAAMFLSAPFIGRMLLFVDPRLMMIAGFALFSVGTWEMTWVTKDYDFWELFMPQIYRGAGLMLALVPITNVALGTLPPEIVKNASGLFNLMRNLGGAVGLALINTALDHRTDLHIARLHESVTWGNAKAIEFLSMLVNRFQGLGGDPQLMALKQLNMIVHREAVVMSYADIFLMMTVGFGLLAFAPLVMKRPDMSVQADAH
jgi:DHA2 family multidrug resistance protein